MPPISTGDTMEMAKSFTALAHRSLVSVSGPEARGFLQGIVTNDMDAVSPHRAVYAALFTPQGKYLHDFFVIQIGDTLTLDCEAARRDDLMRRLGIYRLRAQVTITDAGGGRAVYALFGAGALEAAGLDAAEGAAAPFGGGIAYTDPRNRALGARAVLAPDDAAVSLAGAGFAEADGAAYDRLRIGLGVPDGSRDMAVEKSFPLEFGLDDLNGVDFDKGCFVGQEVTTRMKRRGLVRKRLFPVVIEGAPPAPGTAVMQNDVEAGEVRTVMEGVGSGGVGLALLRLDRLATDPSTGPALTAGGARIVPHKPDWVNF